MTSMSGLTSVASHRPQVLHEPERFDFAPRRGVNWMVVADLLGAAMALLLIVVTALLPAELAVPAVVIWLLTLTVSSSPVPVRLAHQLRTVATAGLLLAVACWLVPLVTDAPADDPHLAAAAGIVVGTALAARIVGALAQARARVRVLLVGAGPDVSRAVSELMRARGRRWEVVGACVDNLVADVALPPNTLDGLDHVADAASWLGADAVLALPSQILDPVALRRLAWQLEGSGADLYVGTGVLDVAPTRTRLAQVGALGMLHVRPAAHSGARRVLKDVVERAACALLVLVLLPIMVGIVIAIRRDSPGPAIFRQQRVGRDGRLFTMYKFRTMMTEAEALRADLGDHNDCDGVLFKMRADPRVTGVGRVLRRYSLDELPQLFNVIGGQMSLVGPRPALPDEVRRYSVDPRRRLAVKPGVTGLWQVSGRSDLSWDESVRLDLRYVDNWSLTLDAAILARTLGAVLGQRGAY